LLPTIKIDSDFLAETFLYTIGTMVEWLSLNTEYLQPLVGIVLPYLLQENLTLQCVLTLKRLTSECGCFMLSYAGEIMSQLTNVLTSEMLRPAEEGSLMQCAGYVLSEMSIDDCMKHLESLLMLKIQQLNVLSEEEPSALNKVAIVGTLDLLSNLFQTLHMKTDSEDTGNHDNNFQQQRQQEQPTVLILQQLTEVFKKILNHWVNDPDVVKSFCFVYDRSVRNLLVKMHAVLPDMCSILATIYDANPHPTVLDNAQRVVTIFAEVSLNLVAAFTQRLMRATLRLFENRYYIQNPDIPHYFFRFLSMVIRKEPELLRFADDVPHVPMASLFQCGMLTLGLLDSESVKTSSMFFMDFLAFCKKNDEAKQAVLASGKQLVEAALRAIGGVGPRSHNQNFADILFNVAQNCLREYLEWMKELKNRSDIPCNAIDHQSKDRFMHMLCTDLKHKRKFRDHVEKLSLACRGLLHTEYGRATMR